MSQGDKSRYYRALKDAGVAFDKHYREYSTDELKAAYAHLTGGADLPAAPPPVPPVPAPGEPGGPGFDERPPGGYQAPVVGQGASDAVPPSLHETHEEAEAAHFFGFDTPTAAEAASPAAAVPPLPAVPAAPVASRDPMEMAGQRLNSQDDDEPIRVDPDTGRVWFQEEVLKPAFPKPRGRRVLTYMDSGAETRTVKAGNYTETFEVAGDPSTARPAEVKITLPSYQVGIYRDPRFPFKVHTYNGLEGFDLFEVQNFYGGAELVPAEIKRTYVENVLCYDIRTTVRAIEAEYRQLQLTGKVQ